jgi:hypothetical protein
LLFANKAAAPARDSDLRPILEAMQDRPLREIAMELTNRNIPAPGGGDAWSHARCGDWALASEAATDVSRKRRSPAAQRTNIFRKRTATSMTRVAL